MVTACWRLLHEADFGRLYGWASPFWVRGSLEGLARATHQWTPLSDAWHSDCGSSRHSGLVFVVLISIGDLDSSLDGLAPSQGAAREPWYCWSSHAAYSSPVSGCRSGRALSSVGRQRARTQAAISQASLILSTPLQRSSRSWLGASCTYLWARWGPPSYLWCQAQQQCSVSSPLWSSWWPSSTLQQALHWDLAWWLSPHWSWQSALRTYSTPSADPCSARYP